MIWDSDFWKRDLLQRSTAVTKRGTQRRWSSASFARLERDVMLGFYAIRKLIEARKISDELAARAVRLTSYSSTGKPITRLNWHQLRELYDLENPKTETRDLLFVCHQVVHSYVFMPSLTEAGGLAGILFASERLKGDRILGISTAHVADLFEAVGRNDPLYFAMRLNPKSSDYDVVVGRHVTPEEA